MSSLARVLRLRRLAEPTLPCLWPGISKCAPRCGFSRRHNSMFDGTPGGENISHVGQRTLSSPTQGFVCLCAIAREHNQDVKFSDRYLRLYQTTRNVQVSQATHRSGHRLRCFPDAIQFIAHLDGVAASFSELGQNVHQSVAFAFNRSQK